MRPRLNWIVADRLTSGFFKYPFVLRQLAGEPAAEVDNR